MEMAAIVIRPTTMAPWTLSVMKEILNPPMAAEWWSASKRLGGASGAVPTSVDGCDDAFHNDDREPVQSRQEVNNLSDGRQFRNHVKEQGQHRHEAEVDGRDDSIALPSPFGQDKALRALAADDGAEGGEDEERQARREGVDNHALHAGNSGELGVSKEDTGSESCEDLAGQ